MRHPRVVDTAACTCRRRLRSAPNRLAASLSVGLIARICVEHRAKALECAAPAGRVAMLERDNVIVWAANDFSTAPSRTTARYPRSGSTEPWRKLGGNTSRVTSNAPTTARV